MIPDVNTALRLTALRKAYRGHTDAVRGLNLSVEEGDFFGFLGPNGAGKSTTLGMVSGLIPKTSGEIHIFEHDQDRYPYECRACLGWMPQEFNIQPFEKVRHVLLTQAGLYGIPRKKAVPRVDELIVMFGLLPHADQEVRHLSGGMRRRLLLARGLVHAPALLILDEPTAGVDVELRHQVWAFLKKMNEAGTTIILTTHYLEEAESLCRNIAIIHEGRLIKRGGTAQLLTQLDEQSFVLDVETRPMLLPEIQGFHAHWTSEQTLEVRVANTFSLNDVFATLTQAGVRVRSLRNKTNRLETLFLQLTDRVAES